MVIRILAVLAVLFVFAASSPAQNGNGGLYTADIAKYEHYTTYWNQIAPAGNGIMVPGNPYSIEFRFRGTATYDGFFSTYRVWYAVRYESWTYGYGTTGVDLATGKWVIPPIAYDRSDRPAEVTIFLQGWNGTAWGTVSGPNNYEIYYGW
jgi:hypothetical protein